MDANTLAFGLRHANLLINNCSEAALPYFWLDLEQRTHMAISRLVIDSMTPTHDGQKEEGLPDTIGPYKGTIALPSHVTVARFLDFAVGYKGEIMPTNNPEDGWVHCSVGYYLMAGGEQPLHPRIVLDELRNLLRDNTIVLFRINESPYGDDCSDIEHSWVVVKTTDAEWVWVTSYLLKDKRGKSIASCMHSGDMHDNLHKLTNLCLEACIDRSYVHYKVINDEAAEKVEKEE